MIHILKLQSEFFDKIIDGTKCIEVRLFDEKRQKIQLGDILTFQKEPDVRETVQVKVIGLLRYGTFQELLNDFPIAWFGGINKEKQLEDIYRFYTKEQEQRYTVLGIRIQVENSVRV